MKDILIAAIAALPGTLIALATLISSIKNSKKLNTASEKLEIVHKTVNGAMEARVSEAKELGRLQAVNETLTKP